MLIIIYLWILSWTWWKFCDLVMWPIKIPRFKLKIESIFVQHPSPSSTTSPCSSNTPLPHPKLLPLPSPSSLCQHSPPSSPGSPLTSGMWWCSDSPVYGLTNKVPRMVGGGGGVLRMEGGVLRMGLGYWGLGWGGGGWDGVGGVMGGVDEDRLLWSGRE